jgi:hypothetical protein
MRPCAKVSKGIGIGIGIGIWGNNSKNNTVEKIFLELEYGLICIMRTLL